jgi:ABC-2 type transport system ATP-binding protein
VEIRSLIRELGQDRTVMLSTHIMQEVDVLCDRVILLSKGKIVADKSMEEIRESSQSLEDMFRKLTK